MRHSITGLTSSLKKGTSNPQYPRTLHHSSLSKRRMENYARYRITAPLTVILFATNTPYHSLVTLSVTWAEQDSIRSLTYARATTTFASKKPMHTKRHSKH